MKAINFVCAVYGLALAAVVSFFDFLFSPFVALPRDASPVDFGPQRLAYDGPTMDLRHESRTSRIGAPRHT